MGKKTVKKNPLDFIVIALGIFLMVVRFTGGAEFFSYIGVLLILIGALSPLSSTECRHCKSSKDLKAKVCPSCGKTQGVPAGSVIIGIVVFAVWIFVEVCMI